MGIVNRRNAIAGWLVWKLAKRTARKKARSVAPQAVETAVHRPKALIAVLFAAGAGLAALLRLRHGHGEAGGGA